VEPREGFSFFGFVPLSLSFIYIPSVKCCYLIGITVLVCIIDYLLAKIHIFSEKQSRKERKTLLLAWQLEI
jgi:hypothetical protein